ncbi:XRE family transcriptional regulator [Actinomadura graeca]|uniref:XRE family transcriptional regulator n=1 Tax=Actinomadura graeca TaxID=2750812 RepID=A0ABX8R1H0_9ACTN|nr:XRE family transcriptional regulator [Actinomadura graeca]QXJ24708.1 XRE family transcriptional regulator [Actinomadura graeca]
MKRRAAIHIISALGAGGVVPPGVLEEFLSGIDHVLDAGTDLEEWDRVVYDYGHQLYRRPFTVLISALTADIVAVGELLETSRPPNEQAGLLRVSAGLSGILADTLGNMGDDRAARRTWSTARRAADASGDRALRVWTRGRAAQHATWAGSSHQAVMTMVDAASEIADGVPSSGLARAYAAGAYTAALYNDHKTASTNLTKLKRTFDQLPHRPGEPTVLGFQESQLHWNEAYVRTASGGKGASDAIDNARTLYPSTAVAPIVNLHLMQAINLAADNDVHEGLNLAVTSLTDRPRPVMATRQLVEQLLNTIPRAARVLPAARELHALTAAI